MRNAIEKSKKFMALLVVCVMMVGLLPAGGVYAVSPFIFDEATRTITGYTGNITYGVSLVIPSSINGVPVEHIGPSAFQDKNITSVDFVYPSNLITIGANAFASSTKHITNWNRNRIATVSIPLTVTTIGNSAFRRNDLQFVALHHGITTIGAYAFSENRISFIGIPNGLTSIAADAFSNNLISTITIPDSITTIGGSAFANNILSAITIPDSVTTIGAYAFSGNYLSSLTISDSVTTIGAHAFRTNLLRTITIPNSVNEIGAHAFRENLINSIIIECENATIGDDLLINTGDYRNNFRENYQVDSAGTYYGTQSGTWAKVAPSALAFTFDSGTKTITDYDVELGGTDVVIPSEIANIAVETIGNRAFLNKSITSVEIPSSIKTINAQAFMNNHLTSVTIPSSVTTIQSNVFRDNFLTSITMESDTTSIGDHMLLTSDQNFRTVYQEGGAGTYTGTQEGTWEKQADAEKVEEAKTAIEAALSDLAVSNAVAAIDILNAANGANLHGVSVAWDSTNGFSKTNATSSTAGSITGTLNLTLNSESSSIAVSKTIAQLPLTEAEKIEAAKISINAAIGNLSVNNATTANDIIDTVNSATLHGVSIAWSSTNGFSKTNATSSTAGAITGTLNLTLNSESSTVAVSKTIAQLPLTEAEKVEEAKTSINAAIGNLSVNNVTTANDILNAANGASLHGVSVAWDSTNGFSKTIATSSAAGAITGTLNFTLGSDSGTISINRTIDRIKASQVVTYMEIDEASKVKAARLEDKVNLPETEDGNVAKITVFLKAEEIQIDKSIKDKTESELAGKGYKLLGAFDIGLYKRVTTFDGVTTETAIGNDDITGSITIRIPLTEEQAQKTNLAIAYVDDEGNVTIIEGIIVTIDDTRYFSFETDHFSTYALVERNRETITKTGQTTDRKTRTVSVLLMIGMGTLLLIRKTVRKQKDTNQ